MRYQYRHSSSNYEKETNAFWFNHEFIGWITLPKEEMKAFIKLIKARYTRKDIEIETQTPPTTNERKD